MPKIQEGSGWPGRAVATKGGSWGSSRSRSWGSGQSSTELMAGAERWATARSDRRARIRCRGSAGRPGPPR